MASQLLASRAQTAPLLASQKRSSCQARRTTVVANAKLDAGKGAASWLAAATVGLIAAQSVYAQPAPSYTLAGLFDSDTTGSKVEKSDQQRETDDRNRFLAEEKPKAPEFQAGLGSQNTERQNLGPDKLIKQQ